MVQIRRFRHQYGFERPEAPHSLRNSHLQSEAGEELCHEKTLNFEDFRELNLKPNSGSLLNSGSAEMQLYISKS
ncbi:hypothetical protein HanOQP8_Chr11g0408491 [Helianthus annuus]|nr:hypothetical protein HanOQP8_Chr11g0408491 [Helianthus annuus]